MTVRCPSINGTNTISKSLRPTNITADAILLNFCCPRVNHPMFIVHPKASDSDKNTYNTPPLRRMHLFCLSSKQRNFHYLNFFLSLLIVIVCFTLVFVSFFQMIGCVFFTIKIFSSGNHYSFYFLFKHLLFIFLAVVCVHKCVLATLPKRIICVLRKEYFFFFPFVKVPCLLSLSSSVIIFCHVLSIFPRSLNSFCPQDYFF